MTDEIGAPPRRDQPPLADGARIEDEPTAAPAPNPLSVTDRIFAAALGDERVAIAVPRLKELFASGQWDAGEITRELDAAVRESGREG